ncbi:MAG: hypothetical protein MZW92_24965 [Comamonadaceae bacterium]|nr:hypothetical protein [Comamonadaceae bacterium]
MPEAEAQGILDTLASQAILLDLQQGDEQRYVLPPPMAGFFEFSLMRVRGRRRPEAAGGAVLPVPDRRGGLRQGALHHGRRRSWAGPSSTSRCSPATRPLHVLDYERASAVIASSPDIGVGLCYCRHKMQHLGTRLRRAARHLHDVRRHGAASLIKHGLRAPRRTPPRASTSCRRRAAAGLVQFGENVRAQRGVHLQLLRLLLRGDDRGAALREPPTRSTPRTSSRSSIRRRATAAGSASTRARSARWRSSRPQDPTHPKQQARAAWTRRRASAAACAWRACDKAALPLTRAAGARHHAARLDASRRADGDRARQAPEPDRRPPGARQPPGHGRHPRGDPQAAAGQAGARQPPARSHAIWSGCSRRLIRRRRADPAPIRWISTMSPSARTCSFCTAWPSKALGPHTRANVIVPSKILVDALGEIADGTRC